VKRSIPVMKTTAWVGLAALLCASPGVARAQAPPAPAAGPLTFKAALDVAVSRNLGLAAARRQRAIREAQIRAAGQLPNPDVSVEATQDTPHYNLSFGLPIEIGGQRGKRIDVAKAELALADLDEKNEMRTLRRNLRQAFYGLVAADERVRLSQDVAQIVERARSVAQARFEEGASPRLDVLHADLDLARAQAEAELARSSRASALADLNAVLNQPAGQAVAVVGDLGDAPASPAFDQAMTLASTSNGDLLAAEREAAIEERRLALLKAERVPTPTVTFGLPMDAPDEFTVGKSIGFSMTVPLFSRNQGEIAASQASILQVRAKADAARRAIESQVYGALARISAQRQQLETYRTRIVPAATELATLAEESYKAGRDSVLVLIDAQRSLRDVKREFLQALLDFQTALADLEEVIGGPIA
jgi:outer membrane protein, heavy metal efflux system